METERAAVGRRGREDEGNGGEEPDVVGCEAGGNNEPGSDTKRCAWKKKRGGKAKKRRSRWRQAGK